MSEWARGHSHQLIPFIFPQVIYKEQFISLLTNFAHCRLKVNLCVEDDDAIDGSDISSLFLPPLLRR